MHRKYLKYVLRHKWHVLVAGLRLGVPLRQLVVHDWSKFLPCEWGPYARRFYGGRGGVIDKGADPEEFHRAWAHHWHTHPHHWEHWLCLRGNGSIAAMEMPERFAREMVADWVGAGRAQLGDAWTPSEVVGWYERNAEKMVLHDATRNRVEALLAEHYGEVSA